MRLIIAELDVAPGLALQQFLMPAYPFLQVSLTPEKIFSPSLLYVPDCLKISEAKAAFENVLFVFSGLVKDAVLNTSVLHASFFSLIASFIMQLYVFVYSLHFPVSTIMSLQREPTMVHALLFS